MVPVTISAIGEGVFIAGFGIQVDCNKVIARQPWHLSNSLLVFKKATGEERTKELILNEVPL